MKIKAMAKIALKFIDDNLPTILTIAATSGLLASVGLAIKETPRAKKELLEAKIDKAEKLGRENPDDLEQYRNEEKYIEFDSVKLTPWEYFKVLAPVYWKMGACVIVTGTCIIMSHHISHKRYLAVLGALALKEKDLEQYKSKIKELFGEKKAQEVEKELNKDVFKNVPEDNRIYYTGHGDYLCYEPLTRSYFRSSQTAVKSGINDFISKLMRDGSATVTDLAFCLDIPIEDTYLDDRSGWSYEGNKGDVPEFGYEYSGHPMTGEPCMVITCYNHPVCGLY